MNVAYTLAGNIYQPSDIEIAMQFAESASKQFGKSVRVLLESKAQYPVLSGVNNLAVSGNSFTFRSIQGSIETRLRFNGAKGDINSIYMRDPDGNLVEIMMMDRTPGTFASKKEA